MNDFMTFHIPFICKLFTTNFTRIFSNLMYEFMFLYIDENDRNRLIPDHVINAVGQNGSISLRLFFEDKTLKQISH